MAELNARQLKAILYATDPAAIAALTHHSRKIAETVLKELGKRLNKPKDIKSAELVQILNCTSNFEKNYTHAGHKLREQFDQGSIIAATVSKLAEAEQVFDEARAYRDKAMKELERVEAKSKAVPRLEDASRSTDEGSSSHQD